MTLLADPIEFELPTAVDVDIVDGMSNVDFSSASMSADGTVYYFRDITYTISNSSEFGVPLTGGQVALPITLGVAVAVIAFGLFMMLKRRRIAK